MTQTARVIPVKKTEDEITVTVRELLADGVVHQEVMMVLRDYFIKKDLWIIKDQNNMWNVMRRLRDGSNKGRQFTNVSLAACVEFALKWEAPHG